MTPTSGSVSGSLGIPSGERWIAGVVEDLPDGGGHHHMILDLEDQRLCLNVALTPEPDDRWPAFSAAAAQRAALSSDRLLPLVALGNSDGRFYVAYEIGSAVPLSAYRQSLELSTARCLALLLGISHALDEATSHGKPPYAVTPDSVFVEPRRGAEIADLGVAREALGNPPPEADRYAPWVAPEILGGDGVHPRSAVFSFGALTYTLLTGAPPHVENPRRAPEPPKVTDLRPDLPEALDVVLGVAMARDAGKRYANAAEARHLVNLVVHGASATHGQADGPRSPRLSTRFPRRPPAPDPAPPARRPEPPRSRASAPRPRPAPQPAAAEKRTRPWLRPALLLAGALTAGALAGTVIAGSGDGSPSPPKHVTGAGMSVTLPDGWQQKRAPGAALAAHPPRESGSGLTVAMEDAPVTEKEQTTPVKLGGLEAWRDSGRVDSAPAEIRYVIPTLSGKVVATCTSFSGAAMGMLATCERTISTLRLRSVRNVPLATVAREAERWQLAAGRLRADRAGALRRLALAQRPAGQLLAAQTLVRAYERAERRFAGLTGGQPVIVAAREAAAAYRDLAAAAGSHDSRRWNAARVRVRGAEAAVAGAVAAR